MGDQPLADPPTMAPDHAPRAPRGASKGHRTPANRCLYSKRAHPAPDLPTGPILTIRAQSYASHGPI